MNLVVPPEAPRVDKSGRRVRAMFASIAGNYDLLNHLLSLNIDKSWRKVTARAVPPIPGAPTLDCCTGTGDLALEYLRVSDGTSPVIAADFCRPMLTRGLAKASRATLGSQILFVEGDSQSLPLADDTFAVVTVAFGLRNVADTVRGIDEMFRVTRPGGTVAILEFSRPRGRILGGTYLFFFKRILPKLGQAVSPNSHEAYAYLPASVLQFPEGEAMIQLLESRGLVGVTARPLTFGVATLYVGNKPST